jgi:hypothetical protein
MSEQNMIGDVRSAKAWVDAQSSNLNELGEQLRVIEQAYRMRTGSYASVPVKRPESVQRLIDSAADEPGREFFDDLRPAS